MTRECIHQFQYLGGHASDIHGWVDARAAYCTCALWIVEATWFPPDNKYDSPGYHLFDDIDVHDKFLKHLKKERDIIQAEGGKK